MEDKEKCLDSNTIQCVIVVSSVATVLYVCGGIVSLLVQESVKFTVYYMVFVLWMELFG